MKILILNNCISTCLINHLECLYVETVDLGKTNLLYHMFMRPLIYFDQVHLYGKNLGQEKYKHMIEMMNDISRPVGYDIIHYNNDEIKSVDSLDSDSQKIAIFDDFICDKNHKLLLFHSMIIHDHNHSMIISFKEGIKTVQRYISVRASTKHQKV